MYVCVFAEEVCSTKKSNESRRPLDHPLHHLDLNKALGNFILILLPHLNDILLNLALETLTAIVFLHKSSFAPPGGDTDYPPC